MDVVLDASVRCEADLHNLAPTASTASAMALGDALAIVLMQARRFTPEEFAVFHPAGQLGRNLNVTVQDAMHAEAGRVGPSGRHYAAGGDRDDRAPGWGCVRGGRGRTAARRDHGWRPAPGAPDPRQTSRALRAKDVMTRQPVTVSPCARLHEALRLMEDRPSQISVLPVVEPETGRCLRGCPDSRRL